jgi:nitrate reductase NapA
MTRNCKELRQANYESMAEIHPQDAARLGIKDGDRVSVASRRATETFHARLTDSTRQGLVYVHMHDPDHMCNRITIDAVDPVSRQPEFKICAVKLAKVTGVG